MDIYCFLCNFACDTFHVMMAPTLNKRTRPFVIAGPCSIENQGQLRQTLEAMRGMEEVAMVRCGVWKPRTRPGGFEGLGETALKWLAELRKDGQRKPVCCEVARPEHVELCLKYGVEAVWIGARTSSDPFSVEEVAQALQGTSLSVMVKNPIAADVNLWQGAIERLAKAGVEHVAAIHRGFYIYRDSCPYRNNPMWEVPIELRRRMPSVPLLCDPSHMGGDRKYIATLMQAAADMGYDGYMIEAHPNPTAALTDKMQQVDFATLRQLLRNTVMKHEADPADERLARLRRQIDTIDEMLIKTLRERMDISEKIAELKAEANMSTYQPKRWEQVMTERTKLAAKAGLNTDFVKTLYEKIHAESVRIQETKIKNR